MLNIKAFPPPHALNSVMNAFTCLLLSFLSSFFSQYPIITIFLSCILKSHPCWKAATMQSASESFPESLVKISVWIIFSQSRVRWARWMCLNGTLVYLSLNGTIPNIRNKPHGICHLIILALQLCRTVTIKWTQRALWDREIKSHFQSLPYLFWYGSFYLRYSMTLGKEKNH